MTRRIVQLISVLVFSLFSVGSMADVSGLPDFTELVEKTGPAVVNIQVTQFGNRVQPGDGDSTQAPYDEQEVPEFFRRFFGPQGNPNGAEPDRRGLGSGFIFEKDGYIITNHHVVDGADQIIVRLADRREFEAELIGTDQQSDIALLKIEASNLPTVKLGHTNELKQGAWVVAIGSPFNFEQTVTAGIVSAKGRSTGAQQYVPFIQTDVAINPGNSGGPLLNMNGEVVGINSWILSGGSGGYIGLSFAIPVETAIETVRQLREHGKVSRGLLGVVVGVVTRELAEALNLDRSAGALVSDVSLAGSADRAGIKPGDVILELNGQAIETWGDLPPLVGANPPGTKVKVLVSRDGKKKTFEATLDALESSGSGQPTPAEADEKASNALGLEVESISAEKRAELGNPVGGVLITRVLGDAAFRAGLRPGDLLLAINNQAVANVDEFESVVGKLPVKKAVALRVMRGGATTFIAFTPDGDE
ncbi:MAG: DegQ family serine endoprotease [Xanthomonadales bacterium]|nr:DegQ family serine endoprotease [Xanthomonadales bacterium]